MPANLYWEEQGVYIQFVGIVKRREVYDNLRKQLVDVENSTAIKYEIIDSSSVEEVYLTEDDMKVFAAHDAGRSYYIKNVKMAFVAQKEDIVSLFDIYIDICKSVNDNWQFGIFETLVAARKWVELD